MNNSNNKMVVVSLIIFVIMTLILFAGAGAYAYFASTKNTDSNVVVEANVASGSYSFITQSNGNMSLTVTPDMMDKNNKGEVANANQSLSVSLKSPDDRTKTSCTYDVVWQWISSDRYTLHTPNNNENEFTVIMDNIETNLTDFDQIDTNNDLITDYIVLKKDVEIESTGLISTIDHEFTTKIYNIDAEQTATLAGSLGKSFKGLIKVDEQSIDCTMEPYEP